MQACATDLWLIIKVNGPYLYYEDRPTVLGLPGTPLRLINKVNESHYNVWYIGLKIKAPDSQGGGRRQDLSPRSAAKICRQDLPPNQTRQHRTSHADWPGCAPPELVWL